MADLTQHLLNIVKLEQRHFVIGACCSGSVYLATFLFPQEIPIHYPLVRQVAFLGLLIFSAAAFVNLLKKFWLSVFIPTAIPFKNMILKKRKESKLRKELLSLDIYDVVEIARARGYENCALGLEPDSPMARRLLSKGIIVQRQQMVNYDPAFEVDELAWDLVQDMQEFHVQDSQWLEGICMRKIDLETAKKYSEKMLPVLHPTVKSLLQRSEEGAG